MDSAVSASRVAPISATSERACPALMNFNQAGGNAFASFLLGWATNGQIDTVRYIGQQWPYFAGYFQDDWKRQPEADR